MKRSHPERGVTLIELVVVMVIIGILAAVAIPSYRNYVMRSQRSDAKDALLAIATQQEKHYLQCNRYATTIGNTTNCAGNQLQGTATSKNGWYVVQQPMTGDLTTFRVRIAAVNGQNQWQDEACRDFDVTQSGVRTARNSATGDNTAECWR
jgi:type IV pilus assembly protein PilE